MEKEIKLKNWIPCTKHNWMSTDRVGIFSCSICYAVGFRRNMTHPYNNQVQPEGTIHPYKCPLCGGATLQKEANCPRCAGQTKPRSSRKEPLSAQQQEVLAWLAEQSQPNQDPIHLPEQKWLTTAQSLKRRGLVETVIVTLWRITEKGVEQANNNDE